jgi:hypothetical protein
MDNSKQKRVMTPEQLEKLKKAREKANEVNVKIIKLKSNDSMMWAHATRYFMLLLCL